MDHSSQHNDDKSIIPWPADGSGSVRISGVVAGHDIHIRRIVAVPAYNQIRLEYENIPTGARSDEPPPDEEFIWPAESRGWIVGARDDVGTEIEETGGAEGRSSRTGWLDGVLDLAPVPSSAATALDIEFIPYPRTESALHPRTVRVSLPLT